MESEINGFEKLLVILNTIPKKKKKLPPSIPKSLADISKKIMFKWKTCNNYELTVKKKT